MWRRSEVEIRKVPIEGVKCYTDRLTGLIWPSRNVQLARDILHWLLQYDLFYRVAFIHRKGGVVTNSLNNVICVSFARWV
jgi:hypothetical protein